VALIENTLFGKTDKVKTAIERIRSFDPLTMGIMDTPYYVAYSGGKDSDAIRILCELAGVKYDLVHNHTTVDAPETVRYVRSVVKPENIEYPELSMWRLIAKKGMPPTRRARYCCEVLKEGGGKGRFVITGVRWAESQNRKAKRGGVEVLPSNIKKKLILNADNDESRQMLENCRMKGKRILNPIIDWTDTDVWELLNYYGCESNPLYQCGYSRVGCVGCPLAGNGRKKQFLQWPKYEENYIRAFQKMVDAHGYAKDKTNTWTSGEPVFDWWMRDKNLDKPIEGQMDLWEA